MVGRLTIECEVASALVYLHRKLSSASDRPAAPSRGRVWYR